MPANGVNKTCAALRIGRLIFKSVEYFALCVVDIFYVRNFEDNNAKVQAFFSNSKRINEQ